MRCVPILGSLLVVLFLFGGLALWRSYPASLPAQEPILIDAILPLTGPASAVGAESLNGLSLAVESINQNGGIHGKPLSISYHDSKTSPTEAVTIFNSISAMHKPLAIISSLSGVSMAIAPLAKQSQIPLIGFIVTTPDFTKNNTFVFRYSPRAQDEVAAILPTIIKVDVHKLGVLYLSDDFGKSINDNLRAALIPYRISIESQSYQSADSDMRSQILKLQSQDCDAIYVVGMDSHISTITTQLKEIGFAGTLLGPSTAASPTSRRSGSTEGMYLTSPISYLEQNPVHNEQSKFKELYESRFNATPTHYAAQGYDTVMLLSNAINRADEISALGIRDSLEKEENYNGVLGPIQTDLNGHEIRFPLIPARIEQGKLAALIT